MQGSEQREPPPFLTALLHRVPRDGDCLSQGLHRHPPVVLDGRCPDADVGGGDPLHGGECGEDRPHAVLAAHPRDAEPSDHAAG